MKRNVVLFGEGIADEKFLKDFIKSQFGIEEIKYINVKGKDSIHLVKNEFEKNTDQGGVNLLIFDADSNYANARDNIIRQREEVGVEFEIFLFPDNNGVGALEDLLLKLTVPEHSGIFECFTPFNFCLKSKNPHYNVPDLKTQIYSYLSFQKLEANEGKRDYTQSCWNLSNLDAKPLRDFLSEYLL